MSSDEYMAEAAYCQLLPCLRENIWRCNLDAKDIKTIWKSESMLAKNFWIEILGIWCEFNHKNVESVNPANQLLWLNSHIRIQDKLVV